MRYLGRYRITPHGHVILQLAGATAGTAAQYTYHETIVFNHPNNDRISVYGAIMLAPCPYDDTGYASNGSSAGSRASDLTTNLAMLRTKFATELHFTGVYFPVDWGNPGVLISGTMLRDYDAILHTGDGSNIIGTVFAASGYFNQGRKDGLAWVQFQEGVWLDAGGIVCQLGQGLSQNLIGPMVTIGNNASGFDVRNGSFWTTWGNIVSMGNGGDGIIVFPDCGMQQDGGVFCCSNASNGFEILQTGGTWIYGPVMSGSAIGASHMWKNGGYGIKCNWAHAAAMADCGYGTGNANGNLSVISYYGSAIRMIPPYAANYGDCTPPLNTIGNMNSIIGN